MSVATLTIKGVPEELVARLKREAADHRRSLNGEVLHRIEQSLSTRTAQEILEEIRRYRVDPRGRSLSVGELKSAIRDGRE